MCFWLPWRQMLFRCRTKSTLCHGLSPVDRVRYLLVDEVGLGKTIEADDLVMRELKLRGGWCAVP